MGVVGLLTGGTPGPAWSQDGACHEDPADIAPRADPRILNGLPASIRDFPSVVRIQIDGTGLCTGTVVSPRWVLSAAHCRPDANPSGLDVHYGGDDVRQPFAGTVGVRRVVNHPGFRFDPQRPLADIGLLELASPIDVQPMLLPPETSARPLGAIAAVVGWGLIGESMHTQVLRAAPVPISDDAPCMARPGWFDPQRMLCVSGAPATAAGRSWSCPEEWPGRSG